MITRSDFLSPTFVKEMEHIFKQEPSLIWHDKEGVSHLIPEMADHHLFSVMENLITAARAQRRQTIETLENNPVMDLPVAQCSPTLLELRDRIEATLSDTLAMNTDAFGETNITSYAAIMTEAAHRAMRDPFHPDYKAHANET
jgi:hypothetical protein